MIAVVHHLHDVAACVLERIRDRGVPDSVGMDVSDEKTSATESSVMTQYGLP